MNDTAFPMTVSCLAGRSEFAPAGMLGGKPGRLREIRINGSPVHPKGRYILEPGATLVAFEAGGGGFGDPRKRLRHRVRADLEAGYITPNAARLDYDWSEP